MNDVIDLSKVKANRIKVVLPYNPNCYYCRMDSNMPVANLPPDRICSEHMAKMIVEILFGEKDWWAISGVHIKRFPNGDENISNMLKSYLCFNSNEAVGKYMEDSFVELPKQSLFTTPTKINISKQIRKHFGLYPESKE